MDKLKIIIEEPSGSRRTFMYNVKSESESKDIVKGIKKDLKPNFSIASWKHMVEKDSNK
jgi:hypothetical protein